MRNSCACLLSFVLFLLMIGGCTQINVKTVNPALKITHICIEKNPAVQVSDFLSVLCKGFNRHGIDTEVYSPKYDGGKPACDYILHYTALRSWDVVPYLSHAELTLYDREGRLVGFAEYHLAAKGGLCLTKWEGTESKMNPVIDLLLQSYN